MTGPYPCACGCGKTVAVQPAAAIRAAEIVIGETTLFLDTDAIPAFAADLLTARAEAS